jgi:hypothetical protein
VAEEIEPRLRDALAQGWDGFTFRLTSWEPIHDTGAHRGDIKSAYKSRPFSTVQFEAAPAEGKAGQAVCFIDNTFVDPGDLGLAAVGEVPLMTLAYLIAQKLHACTDHSNQERPNDRVRDLIDILLAHRPVKDEELIEVRHACIEIFRLRQKQDWPPSITSWRIGRSSTPLTCQDAGLRAGRRERGGARRRCADRRDQPCNVALRQTDKGWRVAGLPWVTRGRRARRLPLLR